MNTTTFLNIALEAAESAEKVMMAHFGGIKQFEWKADRTPVSKADLATEKAIIESIKSKLPRHKFFGEETSTEGNSYAPEDFVWIIDPIDGTINYVHGIPFFASQIALAHKGEILVGVTNIPGQKMLLHAQTGKGAFCNGTKLSVSSQDTISECFSCHGTVRYFDKIGQISNLVRLMNMMKNRGYEDSYVYSLVASGRIDLHLHAHVKLWDIAAAKIIVEEAGGKMTDLKGNEIKIDYTSEPFSILCSNGIIHDKIIEIWNQLKN